jgi:hypothetical protein
MALVGGLTVKHTAREVLVPAGTAGVGAAPAAVRGPVLLAAWDTPQVSSERSGWALRALGAVLVRASFYVFWLPALLSLWWSRRRPGTWVLALTGGLLALLLYRVALRMGYLSERHMALLLLCGVYWAAAALVRIGRRLTPPRWGRHLVTTGLLLVLSAAPLSRSVAPLHADREGFRDAGLWLARHASPGAHVEDPYAWAHYYAGRVFAEAGAPAPSRRPSDWYVVVEHAGNEHPHLPLVRQALAHARQGRPVRRWSVRRGKEMAEVVVYRVPGPR